MSHYFEKGFSVREASWHGLAKVLEEYPGREEAMRLAGHDWNIIELPISAKYGDHEINTDEWKMLVRDDKLVPISVVSRSYGVVPNNTLWDIVDALVGQDNVKYETAGVLKDGCILWVLARIDEPVQIKGDNSPIMPYVCVSTSHDGKQSCKAQAISVRVICWNTYQAANEQSRRTGLEYTFRHTAKVMDRIVQAKEALGLVRNKFNAFIELAEDLADIRMNFEAVHDFVYSFIPDPPADCVTERVYENIENNRKLFFKILDGPTIPDDHRDTAYGVFCAGIEFLDHYRAFRSNETYFRRTVSEPEKLKPKLVSLIREITQCR